jgi:hypothetical protein
MLVEKGSAMNRRGIDPKDAESMGREDKPLLDFSSK